jgi:beta-ribofuranosylaminobenzene 5'-phosphate synthase
MTLRRLQVTAGSRLHFGMLSFGQPGRRQFGGAGAMLSSPHLRLTISESDRFTVRGPLADRTQEFVGHLSRHAAWWQDDRPFSLTIEAAPPQHSGLGSGTQLGMSLAMGLARWFEAPHQSAAAFAAAVGRGKRSAVGIHGALLGGFIMESGKLSEAEISPLLGRFVLPETWRFVLIIPDAIAGISGEAEQRAFERLPPVPTELTAALCRELVCELAPAAACGDFKRFGEALYQYGRLAGQCFAAQQGGAYASPETELLVEHCRDAGVRGVGQSSWGPTVFALCREEGEAQALIDNLQATGELKSTRALIATPDNRGIQFEESEEA